MEIQESEKRRARNLIWNAAGEYGYEPDFKAYDAAGRADLYWNSIIGAARKAYGADTLEALFHAIHGSARESLYEQLLWIGLENAVYQREAAGRRPCRPCAGPTPGRCWPTTGAPRSSWTCWRTPTSAGPWACRRS